MRVLAHYCPETCPRRCDPPPAIEPSNESSEKPKGNDNASIWALRVGTLTRIPGPKTTNSYSSKNEDPDRALLLLLLAPDTKQQPACRISGLEYATLRTRAGMELAGFLSGPPWSASFYDLRFRSHGTRVCPHGGDVGRGIQSSLTRLCDACCNRLST